jgi:biopolymer transport protein ExbD
MIDILLVLLIIFMITQPLSRTTISVRWRRRSRTRR